MTREQSNKILTQITGKGHEYRRNLRTRNWNTIFEMNWLFDYDQRVTENGFMDEKQEQDNDIETDSAGAAGELIRRIRIVDSNHESACLTANSTSDIDFSDNVRDDQMLEGCDEEMSTEQYEILVVIIML